MEVYNEPQAQYSQNYQSYSQPIMQPLAPAIQGQVSYKNQDESFLRWLFDLKTESVTPLKWSWSGYEFDKDYQRWMLPQNHPPYPLMNDNGINWAISLIESYFSPVFLTTDLTWKAYNFTMRNVVRVIWHSLCLRYKEFNLRKSDISRVAGEIESKISAILLGAINEGYRMFFSTQNSYSEVKNLTAPTEQGSPSIFGGISKIFRKDSPQQQQYGGY